MLVSRRVAPPLVNLVRIHPGDLARPGLLNGLVRVWRDARRRRLRFLLDLHDADEDREYFARVLLPENEVWVAEADGAPVGFVAFAPGWVNQLYVAPRHQGRGVGGKLLALAQRGNASLHLWAFADNVEAIDFYRRRGFRVVGQTDGAGNEAKRPDVKMRWDAEPRAGCR